MVCPSDIHTRATLEQIYQRSPSVPVHQLMWGFFKQVGATLVEMLTHNPNDPHISHYYDIEGQMIWSAYDPLTRQTFVTRSENELRTWLEARYCR